MPSLASLPGWALPPPLLQIVLGYTGYGDALLAALCAPAPLPDSDVYDVVGEAARDGMIEVLKHLALQVSSDALESLGRVAGRAAARVGGLAVLRWIVDGGCALSQGDARGIVHEAAMHGRFLTVAYLVPALSSFSVSWLHDAAGPALRGSCKCNPHPTCTAAETSAIVEYCCIADQSASIAREARGLGVCPHCSPTCLYHKISVRRWADITDEEDGL